jgi:predicted nucleotidyltransferase
LSSFVLKWPDRSAVDAALRSTAARLAESHPELLRLGYYGSYARGDWGVGSDIDIVAIVGSCSEPFAERARAFDVSGFPVPAEMLVYTASEWSDMQREGRRFARELERETVWVFLRE